MEQITDVASLDPQATAQHAVPENREDVARIIETARTGWLTKYQVLYLLQHRETLGLPLSTTTPQLPASAPHSSPLQQWRATACTACIPAHEFGEHTSTFARAQRAGARRLARCSHKRQCSVYSCEAVHHDAPLHAPSSRAAALRTGP